MERFNSPALYQPELRLPARAVRALLGIAAVLFTAVLWFGVGTQAGRFDDGGAVLHVTLPPVVISSRSAPDGNAWMTVAARSTAVDCDRTGWPLSKTANRDTLSQ